MPEPVDVVSIHAHKPVRPLLEVVALPGKGRGYVTTMAIPAGTEVHRSKPLATVVSQEWSPETCMGCFAFSYPKRMRVKATTVKRIPPAKDMNFCSDACREATVAVCLPGEWDLLIDCYTHLDAAAKRCITEDPVVATGPPLDGSIAMTSDDATIQQWLDEAWRCVVERPSEFLLPDRPCHNTDLTMCKLVSSCLARRQCDTHADQAKTARFDDLLALQNNELLHLRAHTSPVTRLPPLTPDYPPSSSWPAVVVEGMQLYKFFSNALPQRVLEHTSDLFRGVYYREMANSFGLWEMSGHDADAITDDLELLGYGIYPSAVYFNHACDANIRKVRRGRDLAFYARRDLAAGEEACIAYGSVTEGVEERCRRLKQHYYFDCVCSRCEQERKESEA